MRFPRRIAALILLALLGAALTPGAAQAQRSSAALKVFTNARFHYSWSYPATWRQSPSTGMDVLLLAPDTGARLSSLGINAGLSTSGVRQFIGGTISQMGSSKIKLSRIIRTTRVIHGVPFQMEQATITVEGVTEQAMALGASLHHHTYLFLGIVGLAMPAAHLQAPHGQEELAQIQASFASITVAR
jgi:hypothetical protein